MRDESRRLNQRIYLKISGKRSRNDGSFPSFLDALAKEEISATVSRERQSVIESENRSSSSRRFKMTHVFLPDVASFECCPTKEDTNLVLETIVLLTRQRVRLESLRSCKRFEVNFDVSARLEARISITC